MPAKATTDDKISYASMKAASGALGLEMSLLQKAKAAGCPAFRGSRIYKVELEEWLAKNKSGLPTTNKEEAQILKLLEDVRRLKIANDTKEGILVLKTRVKADMARCLGKIRTLLEQKLENEYPSAVAGLDVPQSRVYGRRLADQILVEFQKVFTAWET